MLNYFVLQMLTADLYDAFNDVGFENPALLKDVGIK